MSIEKFEVGKKYRFLKDGDGDKMYCGVDAKAGQEFTVCHRGSNWTETKDVTYEGMSADCGWTVHTEDDTCTTTTLDDFEEVVENLDTRLETKHSSIPFDAEENVSEDLIQQMITLQKEHNLTLMFDSDEVVVHIGDNDTEYKISSQKELTTLVEASNVLKSFGRK